MSRHQSEPGLTDTNLGPRPEVTGTLKFESPEMIPTGFVVDGVFNLVVDVV